MDNIKFNRTKQVLKRCSEVLDNLEKTGGTQYSNNIGEIKNYFTEYILIIYYGEFEDKLTQTLQMVLERNSTQELSKFISNAMRSIFNRVDKKDIQKTINYFGETEKERFHSWVVNNEAVIQKHQNFVENRHAVAHVQRNRSVSWAEIKGKERKEGKSIDQVGEQIILAVTKSLNNTEINT